MTSDTPLSHSVARSSFWLFSLRIISRGLGFIRTIILARLLAPSDFGLIGIAMAVIVTLDFLSQTGFQTALIQKQNYTRLHTDTAWTFLVIRGIILAFIVFIISPVVAEFFNAPTVDLIIKIIAISLIFSGFRNIGIIFFYKELHYDKHFKFEICSAFVDLALSITLAFVLRNVWAIVWGGLAGNMTRLLMSYLLSDYKPRFIINRQCFRELFQFGKWILISGIVYSLLTQADSMIVGKIVGPAALGFYQMAMLISYLPSSEISTVASQITLPAYSLMQDNLRRLQRAYFDVLRLTTFLSFPLGALIFTMAPDFVVLFLGEKWLPAVTCIKILVFSGILTSITSIGMPVFSAIGVPKIETYLQIGNLIIMSILLYPLTMYWGIAGTAIAVLSGNAILMIICFFYTSRLTEANIKSLASIIAFTSCNVTVMIFTAYGIKRLVSGNEFLQFSLCIVAALIAYVVSTIILDKITNYGIIALIIEKTKGFCLQGTQK